MSFNWNYDAFSLAGQDQFNFTTPSAGTLEADVHQYENFVPSHSGSIISASPWELGKAPQPSHRLHEAPMGPVNPSFANFEEPSATCSSRTVAMDLPAPLAVKQRKKKARTLHARDWEPYRAKIVRLHISEKRPLPEVKEIMEKEDNFFANLRQFRKCVSGWGLDKNVKRKEMQAIVRKKQYRKVVEPNKADLIFKIRDKIVESQKIIRWMKDHGISEHSLYAPSPVASTPSALKCRTVSPEPNVVRRPNRHDTSFIRIPSQEFIRAMEIHLMKIFNIASNKEMSPLSQLPVVLRQSLSFARINPPEGYPIAKAEGALRQMFDIFLPEQSLLSLPTNEMMSAFFSLFYMLANGYHNNESKLVENVFSNLKHGLEDRFICLMATLDNEIIASIFEALFQFCVKKKNISLLRSLLKAGVDPNHQYWLCYIDDPPSMPSGSIKINVVSALEFSCRRGDFDIVRELVDGGARFCFQETIAMEQPFDIRSLALDIDILRYLKMHGAPLHESPKDGSISLLMRAARHGSLEICELLLDYGADVNYTNERGVSAMLLACYNKDWVDHETQVAVCELLASRGADMALILPNKTTSRYYSGYLAWRNICPLLGLYPSTILEGAIRSSNSLLVNKVLKLGAPVSPIA